jgi:hypothetical protein
MEGLKCEVEKCEKGIERSDEQMKVVILLKLPDLRPFEFLVVDCSVILAYSAFWPLQCRVKL